MFYYDIFNKIKIERVYDDFLLSYWLAYGKNN